MTESAEVFDSLGAFIEACKEVSPWREIQGANWDLEIGALAEATAELFSEPPMLLFDQIKGYPPGRRLVSLLNASYKRSGLALGLPIGKSKQELVRLAARKFLCANPIPPLEVGDGPVMENRMAGDDIDLFSFPALRPHEHDGGRYIGTGDTLITRDPESGYVNAGTHRMQLHERDLLGLWMVSGQHNRLICQTYWDRGQSCPVVATFGQDPLLFLTAENKIPWGQSELAFAGGLRGRPLEVIRGPVTGLPIPAHAEVAIEGEVPPPAVEARNEGPFGEWPGYYAGGTIGTVEPQPVIRVKAVYYRNSPILQDEAPLWPGAPHDDMLVISGLLWDQMEKAGIQDIAGVYLHSRLMVVVAIRQRYGGHAKQAGHAALSCSAAAMNGRYVVVVDDDIDPTNLQEVIWAMTTRVDPTTDIETIDGCWATPLDPRMSPSKRASKDHTNSRAIFYAVRPFAWREKFPRVSRSSRELRRQVIDKYQHVLDFRPF